MLAAFFKFTYVDLLALVELLNPMDLPKELCVPSN